MSIFTREMFSDEDENSGVVMNHFANALTVWAAMNYPERSVAQAMAAFNTTREIVMEAVADLPWAFLSDETCDDPAKTTIELYV